MTLLLPLCAFLFASLLVAGVAWALTPGSAGAVERRLGEVTGMTMARPLEETAYAKTITNSLKRLGNIAPKSRSEMGKLQQRLVASGFRSSEALLIFFGKNIADFADEQWTTVFDGKKGDIDIIPEYLNTLLLFLDKSQKGSGDAATVQKSLQTVLTPKNLTVLEAGFTGWNASMEEDGSLVPEIARL